MQLTLFLILQTLVQMKLTSSLSLEQQTAKSAEAVAEARKKTLALLDSEREAWKREKEACEERQRELENRLGMAEEELKNCKASRSVSTSTDTLPVSFLMQWLLDRHFGAATNAVGGYALVFGVLVASSTYYSYSQI